MEQDRFKANSKLYILGMICLVLCLGFLFLSVYILPYFIWGLNYHIPAFVLNLVALFEDNYEYSGTYSKFLVWLIFVIPALITGLISYFVSNYIDNQIYHIDTLKLEDENFTPKEMGAEMKESTSLGLKILGLMLLIVVVILLLQFIIQFTV